MVEREPVPELERRPTHQECASLLRAMHNGILTTCVQVPRLESFSVCKVGYDFEGNRHSVSMSGSRLPNSHRVLFEAETQIDTLDVDGLSMLLDFRYRAAQALSERNGYVGLTDGLQQAIVQAGSLRRDLPVALFGSYSLGLQEIGNGEDQVIKVTRTTALNASQKLDEFKYVGVTDISAESAMYESFADGSLLGELYCVVDAVGPEPESHLCRAEMRAVLDTMKTFRLMNGIRSGDEVYSSGRVLLPPSHLMSLKLHGLSVRGVEEIL